MPVIPVPRGGGSRIEDNKRFVVRSDLKNSNKDKMKTEGDARCGGLQLSSWC